MAGLTPLLALVLAFGLALPLASQADNTVVVQHTLKLDSPQAVRVLSDGTLYVSSRANSRLMVRTPAGVVSNLQLVEGQTPTHFVLDASGNAYVSVNENQIRKLEPDGTSTLLAWPLDRPEEIDRAADGTLYYAEADDDRLVRLELNGSSFLVVGAAGDGLGNILDDPRAVVVAPDETAYVTGVGSDNVFRITPGGVITEIIDATGDGLGNTLDAPWALALDGLGRLYVAGEISDNVFRVDPGGAITEVLDASGDGAGNTLNSPQALAVGSDDTVYVAGTKSDNVFSISSGGTVTEIIDAAGSGPGTELDGPVSLDLDGAGTLYVLSRKDTRVLAYDGLSVTQAVNASMEPNGALVNLLDPIRPAFGPACEVYVAGRQSNNVLCVVSEGVVNEIVDATGDGGAGVLDRPNSLVVDAAGTLHVAAGNVLRRTAGGVITEVLTGAARGLTLDPASLAVFVDEGQGTSSLVRRIDPSGSTTVVIDDTGDGLGNTLDEPRGLLVEPDGSLIVPGFRSDNVFRVTTGGTITEILDASGDGLGNTLDSPIAVARGSDGSLYVKGAGNVLAIRPGGSIEAAFLSPQLAIGVSPANTLFGATASELFRLVSGGSVEMLSQAFADPTSFAFKSGQMWSVLSDGSTANISRSSDEGDSFTLLLEEGAMGPPSQIAGILDFALDESGRAYVAGFTTDSVLSSIVDGIVVRIDSGLVPIVPLLPWGFFLACGALLLATRVRARS